MKLLKRYPQALTSLALLVAGALLFTTRVAGQDEGGWRVVRATYGYLSQTRDVTPVLLQLISSAGNEGRIYISDATLGGDPAPERPKTLRIFARNQRNEEREFTYNEKTSMDIFPFLLRREDPDRKREERREDFDRDRQIERRELPDYDRGRDRDDWRDRDDYNGLFIIRAFYGVNGNNLNVTERLRSMMQGPVLSMKVNNTNMGIDPKPGAEKILIVVYRFQHREEAIILHEGDRLNLP
jgi:hypothetical protein